MRWCGHARHATIFARQNVSHFRQRDFSLPDLHQRSHNAATHFVEKSIALDYERQLRAGFFYIATRQRPHVGFHFVTARAGERFKIMPAQK
jgi:hypothetical protein